MEGEWSGLNVRFVVNEGGGTSSGGRHRVQGSRGRTVDGIGVCADVR